jgi:hypothetical protein
VVKSYIGILGNMQHLSAWQIAREIILANSEPRTIQHSLGTRLLQDQDSHDYVSMIKAILRDEQQDKQELIG